MQFGIDRQLRDGYLKNRSGIGPADYGNINYTAVRASIVAELTPNLENYTIASYTNSDNHGFLSKVMGASTSGQLSGFGLDQMQRQVAAGQGFYDVLADVPDSRAHTQQWQIINTTTWTASDNLKIKNIISYAQYHQRLTQPMFGTNFRVTPTNGIGSLFQFLGFSGANPAAFPAIAPQLAGLIGQGFIYANINPNPRIRQQRRSDLHRGTAVPGDQPRRQAELAGGLLLRAGVPARPFRRADLDREQLPQPQHHYAELYLGAGDGAEYL